jgi:hypothetical protein
VSVINEDAVNGMIAPIPSYSVISYGNACFVYAFFDSHPLSQEHFWGVKQELFV